MSIQARAVTFSLPYAVHTSALHHLRAHIRTKRRSLLTQKARQTFLTRAKSLPESALCSVSMKDPKITYE